MKSSAEIGQLAAALALAQSEMRPAHENQNNPFFKSPYADFASIWGSCRLPLTKHGLAVTQLTRMSDDNTRMFLETVLVHKSGEWVSSDYPITPKDNSPQAVGSAITYARRYALSAMVAISTSESDDDGEASMARNSGPTKAMGTSPRAPQPSARQAPPPKVADDPRRDQIPW